MITRWKSPAEESNPKLNYPCAAKPMKKTSPPLSSQLPPWPDEGLTLSDEASETVAAQLAPPGSSDEKSATPESAPKLASVRLGFTGKLKSGKDFVAGTLTGASIHGFADPLKVLAAELFGTADKNLDGMRATLQAVGQWGRGIVNEQYPLTPERGMFSVFLRDNGDVLLKQNTGVAWHNYGTDGDIWLKALLVRLTLDESPVQCVTGLRFENEHRALMQAGFKIFHVMTHKATWENRIRESGMPLNHPALSDTSEQLARSIDAQVLKELTLHPKGPKLMAVWSDAYIAKPSERLMDIPEFVAYVERLKAG